MAIFCPVCGSSYLELYDLLENEYICQYCESVIDADELLHDPEQAQSQRSRYLTLENDVDNLNAARGFHATRLGKGL